MKLQELKQRISELETQLETRKKYSKVLQEIALALPKLNTFKEVASLILEESKTVLGYDSVDIFLFSEENEKAVLATSVGEKLEKINEKIPFVSLTDDEFMRNEAQNDNFLIVKDILEVPNFGKELAQKINTCSLLKIPIFIAGNYRGVFAFSTSREKGVFVPNEEEMEYVRILSVHICTSIEKIILAQEKSKHYKNFYEVEKIANLGSWTWEATSDILHWSDNLYEIFGIKKSEFKKDYQSFIELLHPDDKEEITSILNQAFLNKNFLKYTHRIIHQKSGKIRFLSCRVNIARAKDGSVVKMFGTTQDITENIYFEQLKKESEERYKNLIEFIPYGLVVHSKGKILFINNAAIKMLKAKSKDDFLGKNIQEFVHQDSKKLVQERVKNLEQGEKAPTVEEKFICIDGSLIDVETTGMPFVYNEKKAILACFQDISERKIIEKAKVENEQNFKNIFTNSPDAIFVEDYEGNVLNANKAACKLHGFSSPNELIGKNVLELIPKKNIENAQKEFTKLLDGELTQIQSFSLREDGKEIPVEIRGSKIIFNGKKALLLHVRNISDRIELEEEMLKIKKLESIGVLAGGIAHDFNNILTGILANLSLAKILLNDQKDVEARIKEAEKATFRARDLTHQLLTFAKGGLPILSIASIVNLIKDSTKFALRGSKVKSDFSIQEDLWPVDVDKGQIGQVIHNLVLNASQAMQEGGTIQISAKNILLENESELPLEKGNYVKISITDEGTGIAQQYLDKIFDPYFTTKETGSGLGLATTFSIIKNHQGHISVDSKIGIGTKFSFYLKSTDGSVPRQEVFSKEEIVGKGKILIMDDDEAIREILLDVLQHIGYEAVTTSNGFEAITKYKDSLQNNNKFDVVILDLTIPGSLGGGETIEKLLEIDPNVKAIVSSGYSNSPIMRDYEKFGFQAIIKKPYNVKELSEVLAKVTSEK